MRDYIESQIRQYVWQCFAGKGEANLPKASVVNVSQILTVDKSQLGEYIGTLSSKRVNEILDGIYLFLEPRDLDRL